MKDDSSDILGDTWSRLSVCLQNCNHEIKRAVSEVWASVIRRAKKVERQKCIELMVLNLEGNDDVVAWSLVFASKVSKSQLFHSNNHLKHLSTERRPDLAY